MQARMHEIKTIHFKHRRSYKYILDRKFYVNIGVNSCNVSRLVHILNPTSLSEDIHLSLCKWPLAYAAMIMWCTCEINAYSKILFAEVKHNVLRYQTEGETIGYRLFHRV